MPAQPHSAAAPPPPAAQQPAGGCNPVRKAGPVTLDHVLLALRESEQERDARIRSLFARLTADVDAGLAAHGVPPQERNSAADEFRRAIAAGSSSGGGGGGGGGGYEGFRRYMDRKELELYRIFQTIDVEHNGCILPDELWEALRKAGIDISGQELARFVEHVDTDNNGIITFEEWRDFLLFYPHEATIANIYQYWERVCLVDIGEQAAIPEGISKHKNTSMYLIAGGVAGAASRTATAPLDRLKVVMQVQTSRTQVISAIRSIWKDGGLLGFYRGNGLNVMKVAPESAVRFYTYEMLKDFIRGNNKNEIGPAGRLLAGGTAGAIAQTAIYPIDLVKTRLQTCQSTSGKCPSILALSRDIWVHEGPRAFYRGIVPSLLGIVPYAGIDLAVYETLRDMSKTYIPNNEDPGPLVQLGCGTISGALGATCVYPLQVIRTRMQAQRRDPGTPYSGMSEVFWRTLKHEGVSGFYKGILPNLLKVVPAASITYLVYETMKKSFSLD